MKLIDILEPLSSNNSLTEEYSYNHYGDYAVIDGSTTNNYKQKIDTFDYDGTCLCITTAGIYAGNVSLFSGKFSVGNNVKCYFLRKQYQNINIKYFILHLTAIAEKCLTGKSGGYTSLNTSMFENFDIKLVSEKNQKKYSKFYDKYKKLISTVDFLNNIIKEYNDNLNIGDYEILVEKPADKIFVLSGGYSLLTEEYRYNNSDDSLIPVFTGAKKFENFYVNKKAVLKKYIYDNFDMKVTRKGDAGYTMLVCSNTFTINDDAYAVKNILDDDIINNKYFYLWLFRKYASMAVVDEDGNGTFSKTKFLSIKMAIPKKETQEVISKYMFVYESTNELYQEFVNELFVIKNQLRELEFNS